MPSGLLFTGGAVYTPDATGRRLVPAGGGSNGSGSNGSGDGGTAVAVRGGRITAVGAHGDRDVRDAAGPGCEVFDLRGRALLPGFQDAHVHPAFAGLTMVRCNLIGAQTLDEALDRIARYIAGHPEAEWVAGSGWRMEWFAGGLPSRQLLDQHTGGRPAFLVNRDVHGAWANTRALELAGIGPGTPDPPDGRIEREPDGGPQGTLHEGAATLVGRHVPAASLAEKTQGLLLAQQHLHARGITAWQDAIVGDYLGNPDPLPAYLAAARAGTLTARVRGALWWDRHRGGDQFDELLARREEGQAGRFTAGTVKIMQDGVAENFSAGMIEEYLDSCGCQSDSAGRGLSYVPPDVLREQVTRLDAAGFQVHLHAIGDRAVRESLDAVQAARTANGPAGAGPGGGRHHIAHLQVMHPDDVPRFAELGVTANIQALWAAHEPQMDELTIPFLGPERASRQYLFGDLLRSGARLAAGSDWAVSSANPMRAVHVAVNRALPGARGAEAEPFLPAQGLGLAEALAAYTAGSAYVNHLDGDGGTGAVEPGRLADLVVLERDPFAHPPGDLGSTRVLATYVQGDAVYQRD
jgi:predicted amidohydrolase YtcJ